MDPNLALRLESMERARDSAELTNMELQTALSQLETAAGTDRLTGAWNRRRFDEGASGLMALSNRRRDPLPLILFDLDHFKRVNDTYGHNAGDLVLVQMVQVVRALLRASDFITRWGGEEFVILAPGTHLSGAAALAGKIREAVESTVFPGVGQVTISMGVTAYRPGETLEEWVQRADQALYRAKAGGRNQVATIEESGTQAFPEGSSCSLLELHWDQGLECGHAAIDAQHRVLFEMMNALLATINTFPDSAEVELRLQLLQAHIAQHFHDEESYLGQVGYPRLAIHAEAHKQLLEKAGRFRDDLREGRLDLGKVLGFLAIDVVRDHLRLMDRDFFPYFQRP